MRNSETSSQNQSLPKVSLCTTCKGRARDVADFFLKNIELNPYPNVEFVLLNYSSTDSLDVWAKKELKELCETGKVIYGHVYGMRRWTPAHPKNISHRLATGDIICNVDADNSTGTGFVDFLASSYSRGYTLAFSRMQNSTYGRIAVEKSLFYGIGGYDESLEGYGWEDVDLEERALASGARAVVIPKQFLRAREQTREEKIENYSEPMKDISKTNLANKEISIKNVAEKRLIANAGWSWGSAIVRVNWSSFVELA